MAKVPTIKMVSLRGAQIEAKNEAKKKVAALKKRAAPVEEAAATKKPATRAKPKKAAAKRKKAGRPKVKVDVEEMEKLAGLQCTYAEAAAWMDCSLNTIKRRMRTPAFREAWDRGREKGKVSLRRNQFSLSRTNAGMAIFLGKQYLGQRDVVATE